MEAARGAKDAIADLMKACTDTKEKCREEMKTKMERLQGRTFSKGEMAGAMQEAGASAASAAIKACIQNAADATEKRACMTGTAAKDAFAKASGRDASKIKDVDLKKAAQE